MEDWVRNRVPGEVVSWEEKCKEYEKIMGNEELVRRIWQDTDFMAYMYAWQLVVSF